MDINKLNNVINENNDLKKNVFFNYIKEYILELVNDNQILEIDDKKSSINFLNYESYILSYEKSIGESIDEFESLMPKYREYSKNINEILNKNIKDFKSHLLNLQEKLKIKYFYCKYIEFLLTENDYNKCELSLRIFMEDNSFTIQVPIKYFWIYINNKYDDILNNLIKDTLKIKIIKQLELMEGMSNYKIIISENQTKIIDIIDMKWQRQQISFPIEILTNKQIYDEAIYELDHYLKREKYQKYLNEFYNKFSFIKQYDFDFDYNLEKGLLNTSFDLNKFDNIEKFYNDIKKYENECEILKTISEEKYMYDYKFMNKIFINKIDIKEVNGDKYSVYKYSCGKKKNIMFFKNGIKINRTKYHETAILLGYNKKIIINNYDYNDWSELSKKPLLEEQIEKYKDELNWKYISLYHKLTDEMLIKYYKYINWEIVLKNRKIKRTILEQLAPLIGWTIISEFARMNEKFLMDHLYDLDMEKVLKNPCCKFAHDIVNTLINSK